MGPAPARPAAAPGSGHCNGVAPLLQFAAGAAPGAEGAAAPPAPAALPEGVERLRTAALGTEPKTDLWLSALPRYFKAEDGSTRTVMGRSYCWIRK